MKEIIKIALLTSVILIVLALFTIVIKWDNKTVQFSNTDSYANNNKFIVYKDKDCSCCEQYIEYLNKNGFEVKTVKMEQNELEKLKDREEIPKNLRSCHTAKYGQYFIEWHVPVEAINKLISDKPNIKGIALPGMDETDNNDIHILNANGHIKIYQLNNDNTITLFMELN